MRFGGNSLYIPSTCLIPFHRLATPLERFKRKSVLAQMMQTPVSMVMGIVFAPLGLVLVFTAAITPQWREGQARLNIGGTGSLLRSGAKGQGVGVRSGSVEALLLLRSDGLWESCLQVEQSELKQCWPIAGPYQRDARVRLVQGLVLTSLFLCGIGIVLACIGVRCWTDLPLRRVAASGGLLVVAAGLLSLTGLGVYTHNLRRLGVDPSQGLNNPKFPQLSLSPAGSLYFGWLGSCLQVLGGGALLFSFKRPRCPTCPSRQEQAVCPACHSCPEMTSKTDVDVYEVSC
ncbi:claudin-23-like [Xiphophorus maculatus]|nr:claudin-23-like [Xiphophorus maculatus]XP_023207917.1 claudin-23-like [Xiphophorus maculatus]XP_023207918.1 claudin-23-like [Xiphophorus maculatus]XP_032402821.1 claudin-23-like [Xiphophorus hellerii]XP_032402822.1 claudin-23-like [Xiphophorus hellerii]XP_032402823.1 claudin-23-like [Xiphophorus hellerii]XP_032402824.1 claudin-23-like [Xiphophorus hellerii]XP_032402825.1 claudin-23-like [Xiphophorus hellerii]XP_032402826.1 claudin-23-like [Xiphophorus hellerii]XP_032402827.1 claudin-23-